MNTDFSAFRSAHVVVIGGSSGIGLAAASAAKAQGAVVTLVGRSAERLQTAARELGGAATAVADIADRESVDVVFSGLERVDHLIITAGSIRGGRLVDTNPDMLIVEIIERLAGPMYAIRAALPFMTSSSSIVLTGGQCSDRPTDGAAMLSAGVRGVEALARALALELKPIRVNVIAPGIVETPLFDVFGADGRAAVFETAAERLPVGRAGRPEEIGAAIVFLMSNGYVNGEVLHIDGGGRFV